MSEQDPRFSIIVPVFNRETTILRALGSCLRQTYPSFEVVVIDDGSTDSTAQILDSIEDPRVRLVTHSENRGVGAARHSGISVAKGRWLVILDSDDELNQGALDVLGRLTEVASPGVGNVATQCLRDDGVSPGIRSVPPGPLDYRHFLEWSERLAPDRAEWFNCIRRRVLEEVSLPTGRAHEGGFHLDLAEHWLFEIHSEVVVRLHRDVPGITQARGPAAAQALLRDAPDQRAEIERILERHGDPLRVWAPRRYASFLRAASLYSFLTGARGAGTSRGVQALRRDPFESRIWVIMILGTLHPTLLARVKAGRG